MSFLKKYGNIIFTVIVFTIIAIGCIFRLKAYLTCKPVWLDEAFLFFNIYERSFSGFFTVLDWWQSAPPLFLAAEKVVVSVCGIEELSLRLIPLLCSCVSLPIFYLFSKSILHKKFSIITANILFAINLQLIFYAQELKQYSLDILCFLLLFLFLKDLSINNLSIKNSIKYILLTAFSPFFSLISYFPISAWFIREIIVHRTQHLKKLFVIQIPLILLSIYYYFAMLKPQRLDILSTSANYWQQGYFSLDINNNINIMRNFILYAFEPCNNIFLLALLLVFGTYILAKNYKKNEAILLLIIITEIATLSFLKIYPIYERVSLFLIPICIVIISKIFDDFHLRFDNLKYLLAICLLIVSFYNYNYAYITQRVNGDVANYTDARRMMRILKNKYKPDESVIVNNSSIPEYLYYKLYFNFEPAKEIYTEYFPEYTKTKIENNLNNITEANKKYWFFYSIDYTNDKIETETLKSWKNNYKVLRQRYKRNNTPSYLLYLQK